MAKSDQYITMITTVPVNLDNQQKHRLARLIAEELSEDALDDLIEYIMSEVVVGHLSKRIATNAGGGK
jgi:hypothetical protein